MKVCIAGDCGIKKCVELLDVSGLIGKPEAEFMGSFMDQGMGGGASVGGETQICMPGF